MKSARPIPCSASPHLSQFTTVCNWPLSDMEEIYYKLNFELKNLIKPHLVPEPTVNEFLSYFDLRAAVP